jgi:RNA polymerase sigma-70 factor (ECF subfamily)
VTENQELEALLRRAQAGDTQAREALIGLLRARARRYADFALRGHLGARLDASDVAQEVAVRVARVFNPANFPDVPRVLAWLNTVVRGFVADIRTANAAGIRDAAREQAGEGLFHGLASDSTGPEERAARAEVAKRDAARLEAALGALPKKQRDVLCLRLREGLPCEEVARRVGVSPNHVSVLLYRATSRLRELLGEPGRE